MYSIIIEHPGKLMHTADSTDKWQLFELGKWNEHRFGPVSGADAIERRISDPSGRILKFPALLAHRR